MKDDVRFKKKNCDKNTFLCVIYIPICYFKWKYTLKSQGIPGNWIGCPKLPGLLFGLAKTSCYSIVIKKKGFILFCELHTLFAWVIYKHLLLQTFCQKYLGLNNVKNVFHNMIQVAPLGQETVDIVMYIFKDLISSSFRVLHFGTW